MDDNKIVHVVEHEREPHKVVGHYKNRKNGRYWYGPSDRNGSTVDEHYRARPRRS